jgi:hypothetical protein
MTEAQVITEIGERPAAVVRARGEASTGSDYALLVIEPSVENAAVESTRLRDELDDLRTPIDVVVVAEDVSRHRGFADRSRCCRVGGAVSLAWCESLIPAGLTATAGQVAACARVELTIKV